MAKKPIFITGANAKLKVDGKTFAYAQDVSYSVAVDTIPVETMGRYEAVTNEPVNYSVAGEFAIVRYTSSAVAASAGIDNPATGGNGLGAVKGTNNSAKALSSHVNPGEMLNSATWDLEVYQKGVGAADTVPVIKVTDCRITRKSGGLNKRGILVERISFVGILHSDDSTTAANSTQISNSGDTDLA
jgi:hypothetical protein